jgi:hypothetical protein
LEPAICLPRFRTDYAVERAVLVTELRQFLLHSNNSLLPPDTDE